jgi:uncharacterized membrane protein
MRILNDRRLFMQWGTVVFSILIASLLMWLSDARGGVLIWFALVSLGGGWLFAFFMWELNYAAAHAWDSGPRDEQRENRHPREGKSGIGESDSRH